MKSQLEKLATEFYNESGASVLDIVIRITSWETTRRIAFEFSDGHDNTAATAKAPGGCRHD